MRCLFCKQPSEASRSVEHIVPESLGNTEHVLPKGIVCDSCNNYFAREVEGPFLESLFIKEARFKASIPSKRGVIPPMVGMHLQSQTLVQLIHADGDGAHSVAPLKETDNNRWVKGLGTSKSGTLIFPSGVPSDGRVTSRFVAKVGLEVLAERVSDVTGGVDYLIDKPELEEVRRYARRGDNLDNWPVNVRTIYLPDSIFTDRGPEPYQVSHEHMIFLTEHDEYYIVIAIFGVEYALNLGGPEIDGYRTWLSRNEDRSPLYFGRQNEPHPSE